MKKNFNKIWNKYLNYQSVSRTGDFRLFPVVKELEICATAFRWLDLSSYKINV